MPGPRLNACIEAIGSMERVDAAAQVQRLLDVVRRALARQPDVEGLLEALRDDDPMAAVAPRAGPVVSEYVALRRELEPVTDPRLVAVVAPLAEVLDFHAQVLHYALRLVSESWRSPALRHQQRQLGGLGAQGERLWTLAAAAGRLAADVAGPARAGALRLERDVTG